MTVFNPTREFSSQTDWKPSLLHPGEMCSVVRAETRGTPVQCKVSVGCRAECLLLDRSVAAGQLWCVQHRKGRRARCMEIR